MNATLLVRKQLLLYVKIKPECATFPVRSKNRSSEKWITSAVCAIYLSASLPYRVIVAPCYEESIQVSFGIEEEQSFQSILQILHFHMQSDVDVLKYWADEQRMQTPLKLPLFFFTYAVRCTCYTGDHSQNSNRRCECVQFAATVLMLKKIDKKNAINDYYNRNRWYCLTLFHCLNSLC